MRSFRTKISGRRAEYLALTNDVERQLLEAYDRQYANGENQNTLGKKLGVHRSVINRRLTGRTNMTLETLADMVWALGQRIKVSIYDPKTSGQNNFVRELVSPRPQPVPKAPPAPASSDSMNLLKKVMDDATTRARSPAS